MTAATSPAPERCTVSHQWSGVGRRAHTSGTNPRFVCTRELGHTGPHAFERVPSPPPAPVRVADLPAPRTPTPVQPDTLAKVMRGRIATMGATVRPLPTTEEQAQIELTSQRTAKTSSLAAHYYRRWLESAE